ncbi:hypothetical protein D3C87_2077840 [compost metagenome]
MRCKTDDYRRNTGGSQDPDTILPHAVEAKQQYRNADRHHHDHDNAFHEFNLCEQPPCLIVVGCVEIEFVDQYLFDDDHDPGH